MGCINFETLLIDFVSEYVVMQKIYSSLVQNIVIKD